MANVLAERLKIARKRRGLTQEQLAQKVKTTKATISNYENRYSTPSNEMLVDLANALSVTTDYLLGRSNYPELTAEQERKVDKKVVKLLKIIESMPEDKREELEEKIIAYAKGLADASRDHVDLD